MMNEPVELEIKLDSTFWNKPPICKIWIDDQVILQRTEIQGQKIVSWVGNLSEGDHEIKISLLDKDGKIETVTEGGNIIKDQILSIKSIQLDQIDIGFLLHSQSSYLLEDGTELNNTIDLGQNGTYSLKFSVPTYMWLLENL